MATELVLYSSKNSGRIWPAALAVGVALTALAAPFEAAPPTRDAMRAAPALAAPAAASAARTGLDPLAATVVGFAARASGGVTGLMTQAGVALHDGVGAVVDLGSRAGPIAAPTAADRRRASTPPPRMLMALPARLAERREARPPGLDAPIVTGEARPARTLVVYFDFASARLTRRARVALSARIAALGGSAARVTVNGHADSAGAEKANLRLSAERAAAVRAFLAQRLSGRPDIDIHAYGESRPARRTANGARSVENRRVEIVIR